MGMIRNVAVEGNLGTKVYDIVLTDQRFIFVLARATKEHVAAGLGSVAGGVGRSVAVGLAGALTPPRELDVVNADPETLAQDWKNVVIAHESIVSLLLVQKWARHRIRIRHMTRGKKPSTLEVFLEVPWDVVKGASKHGVHPKTAIREHMNLIRDTILRAIPPDVAQRAEWRF